MRWRYASARRPRAARSACLAGSRVPVARDGTAAPTGRSVLDGTKLVVFRTLEDGLRAFYGKRLEREEVVTRGERDRYPTASFTRAGRARVEWQAGASTREIGA